MDWSTLLRDNTAAVQYHRPMTEALKGLTSCSSHQIMPAVLSSGCLSSHSVFNSDHRAYFLDFDTNLLFSDLAYEIERPVYRQLRLHDPRLIDQYSSILHDQLRQHKVIEKLEDLQQAIATDTWTEAHTTVYQSLDAIITDSMLHAERVSGKSFSKCFEWSPKLTQAVQAFRYWKLGLRKNKEALFLTPG